MKEEIFQESENTAFIHLFGKLLEKYSEELRDETKEKSNEWHLQGIPERLKCGSDLKRWGSGIVINLTSSMKVQMAQYIILDYKFKMWYW